MRLSCLLIALGLAATAAAAQTPAERPDPRKNQKIERIRVEDSANRVDELRVGGQTQNITVQPKGKAPSYEIQPTDLSRSRPADNRDGMSAATGKRVWNIGSF
jgi:starvation-inducible outer membrane lipoprotein